MQVCRAICDLQKHCMAAAKSWAVEIQTRRCLWYKYDTPSERDVWYTRGRRSSYRFQPKTHVCTAVQRISCISCKIHSPVLEFRMPVIVMSQWAVIVENWKINTRRLTRVQYHTAQFEELGCLTDVGCILQPVDLGPREEWSWELLRH